MAQGKGGDREINDQLCQVLRLQISVERAVTSLSEDSLPQRHE